MERDKKICSKCDGSGMMVKNGDAVSCDKCGGDGFVYTS